MAGEGSVGATDVGGCCAHFVRSTTETTGRLKNLEATLQTEAAVTRLSCLLSHWLSVSSPVSRSSSSKTTATSVWFYLLTMKRDRLSKRHTLSSSDGERVSSVKDVCGLVIHPRIPDSPWFSNDSGRCASCPGSSGQSSSRTDVDIRMPTCVSSS